MVVNGILFGVMTPIVPTNDDSRAKIALWNDPLVVTVGVTFAAQERYIRIRHLRYRTITATTTATQIPGLRRISK